MNGLGKHVYERGIVTAMSLATHSPIAFLPTQKPVEARRFYEQTLGLTFVEDDGFAMVYRLGTAQIMLRVVRAPAFEPLPFTLLGWETPDMDATIDELTAKGVEFLRFSFVEQDERGIWHTPNGIAVAWFKDPDGNMLSVSKHT